MNGLKVDNRNGVKACFCYLGQCSLVDDVVLQANFLSGMPSKRYIWDVLNVAKGDFNGRVAVHVLTEPCNDGHGFLCLSSVGLL